jgi:hypothetical protein
MVKSIPHFDNFTKWIFLSVNTFLSIYVSVDEFIVTV